VGGRAGHAARISFNPLRLRHVPIPTSWRFVVASSLTHAEKSGAVQAEYNARGSDTRAARAQVATRLPDPDASYADLLARFDLSTLLDAARGLDEGILRRFRHVVTEGLRVERAMQALAEEELAVFGGLLDASHLSLQQDYEVSSAELDELVAAARSAGASGARLTGAGFGGSIVAVTDARHVDRVVAALREQYYAPKGVTPTPAQLFVAVPSDGAGLDPAQPNALPISSG
jgi:galactokinase